jgi:hypothetical protein
MPEDLSEYAKRFHAVIGDRHHVGSPLGAWLVLALCGDANDPRRAEAAALLGRPHPLVAAAAAVWERVGAAPASFTEWYTALPDPVVTGPIPEPAELDRWAREHTYGLIERFPVPVEPATLLVLASALATKVQWNRPFDVVPAARLGDGPWTGRLTNVLHTPAGRAHDQRIVATAVGDVAVHTAKAHEGLEVTSVLADSRVPAQDVIAAAYEVATAPADRRRSLFDLPLGEYPLWTITEESAEVKAPDGREERCTAILPAWSAEDDFDLSHDSLGFAAAARRFAERLGRPGLDWIVRQAAMARYHRFGFEAAAVTAMATRMAFVAGRDGVRRTAELRFAHPYAVVAVTREPGTAWDGVPVFSGWVSEPEEVLDLD